MKYGHRVPIPNFIIYVILSVRLLFTGVDFCQTAFTGFTESVVQIDTGFMHSTANHIIANAPGTGEEVAEVAGVHGAHGGYGVTLNTGDLNKTADRITGQTQVVLHGNFGSVFHLIEILLIQFSQSGSGHGTCSADFGLTTGFGTGDGGVTLGERTNDTSGSQNTDDLFVSISLDILCVFQNSGQYAAGTAGRRCNDRAVIGILLGYRICIGSDVLEFLHAGSKLLI